MTTHNDATFEVDGVVHYGVANVPGAVPRTSTFALTNASFRYVLALADRGFRGAVTADPPLALGVNVLDGNITFEAVARAQRREHRPLEELL